MDHAPVPLAPGTHRRRFPPGRRRVGPLALSAGVFRAGFLGERVQDRVQRGGALRGQITFHPARAMQRAVQPQPPTREPIISVGVGLGGQAACPADRAGGRAAGDPGLPPKHARAEPCPSSSQPLQEMNAANAPARAAVCSDSARSNPAGTRPAPRPAATPYPPTPGTPARRAPSPPRPPRSPEPPPPLPPLADRGGWPGRHIAGETSLFESIFIH